MKDKKPLTWIPLFIDKHLFGSTRYELDPAERSVWTDLLAFSGKDNGHIRANEGVPYPLAQLAGIFLVPEELLKRTIRKCIKYGKIEILKDKTMYLPSWNIYRLSDRHIRRVDDEMSAKPDTMSAKPDAKSIDRIENRKSIEREEEVKINIHAEQIMQIQKLLIEVKGIGKEKASAITKYIVELSAEFPDLDCVEQMQKKCAWWIDNPLNKKSNIHLQIRNWFLIAQKHIDEAKQQHSVGSESYLRKQEKNPEFEQHRDGFTTYLRDIEKKSPTDIRFIMDSAEMFFDTLKAEWHRRNPTKRTSRTFFELLKKELHKK